MRVTCIFFAGYGQKRPIMLATCRRNAGYEQSWPKMRPTRQNFGAKRRPGGARGTKWSGHVPWGTAAKRRGGKTGRKSAPRVEARKAAISAAFLSFVAGGGLSRLRRLFLLAARQCKRASIALARCVGLNQVVLRPPSSGYIEKEAAKRQLLFLVAGGGLEPPTSGL